MQASKNFLIQKFPWQQAKMTRLKIMGVIPTASCSSLLSCSWRRPLCFVSVLSQPVTFSRHSASLILIQPCTSSRPVLGICPLIMISSRGTTPASSTVMYVLWSALSSLWPLKLSAKVRWVFSRQCACCAFIMSSLVLLLLVCARGGKA